MESPKDETEYSAKDPVEAKKKPAELGKSDKPHQEQSNHDEQADRMALRNGPAP